MNDKKTTEYQKFVVMTFNRLGITDEALESDLSLCEHNYAFCLLKNELQRIYAQQYFSSVPDHEQNPLPYLRRMHPNFDFQWLSLYECRRPTLVKKLVMTHHTYHPAFLRALGTRKFPYLNSPVVKIISIATSLKGKGFVVITLKKGVAQKPDPEVQTEHELQFA